MHLPVVVVRVAGGPTERVLGAGQSTGGVVAELGAGPGVLTGLLQLPQRGLPVDHRGVGRGDRGLCTFAVRAGATVVLLATPPAAEKSGVLTRSSLVSDV